MRSRLSLAIPLAISLIAASPPRPIDEYQVKAAFLYNFAMFVEWPSEVYQDEKEPFVICVLGQDPFGGALDEVVAGKKIRGMAFAVRRISAARPGNGCRILFASFSEPRHGQETLAPLNEPGVLTVGESRNSPSEDMIINLTLEGGRVRFEINTDLAERGKLRISSKLLSLAKIVKK